MTCVIAIHSFTINICLIILLEIIADLTSKLNKQQIVEGPPRADLVTLADPDGSVIALARIPHHRLFHYSKFARGR